MRRRVLFVCCAALILLVLPLSAKKQAHFAAFYVFGDSLVDNGNDFIASQQLGLVPAIPPSVSPHDTYFEGRFSNGPIEFEYLWQMLEHRKPGTKKALIPYFQNPCDRNVPAEIGGAVDFGFGGSGTGIANVTLGGFSVPGLLGQLGLFNCALHGQTAPPDALYAIWSGANDYFNYLSPAPVDPILTPTQVVANIIQAIQLLYAAGARHIIVLNQPDLGNIPLVLGTAGSPILTGLSQEHNTRLATALTQLQQFLPDLDLISVDVKEALSHVPADANKTLPALDALFPPAGIGQIPMSRCLFLATTACQDVPTFDVDFQYAFWDVEHPTTEVHRLIAEQIYSRMIE